MINECAICGGSGERLKLFDAISKKGIIKICKECAINEDIPFLQKTHKTFNPPVLNKNINKKRESVYERLSHLSGFDLRDQKTEEEKEAEKEQEDVLRNIVNRNFDKQSLIESKSRPDLIENFHWIIMRARRAKHLTQEQLAKEIAESEAAIKMIEKATFPENSYNLIKKIENYLGIKITKKEFEKKPEKRFKEIGFDRIVTENLTIADLQEMKKRRENEILDKSVEPKEKIENRKDDFSEESTNHNL